MSEQLKPLAAIESLRNDQTQLDDEGVMVAVSRQAIHEVLAYLGARPTPNVAGDVVERRIKNAAYNGCLKDKRGEYCEQCVGMATDGKHYAPDRRANPHNYLSAMCNTRSEPQGKAQEITTPLNGGIRQASEPFGFGLLDSTSRESLLNSCERGDTQPQPVPRDELVNIVQEQLPSLGFNNPLNPFKDDLGNGKWANQIAEDIADAFLSQFNLVRKGSK